MFQLFKAKPHTFIAPMCGVMKPLEEVADPVFSSKSMGDGFAVALEEGKVVSPVDGEIMAIFPTKHAIGILGKDGYEYLLHIGLDTVYLQGEGFDLKVQSGDQVKPGDLLLEVDLELLRSKQIDLTSPVIVTNLDGRKVKLLKQGPVSLKEADLIQII